jgi:nitroreductase
MDRRAQTTVPIHDLVAERWSPVGFDRGDLGDDDLAALFEAARWAASAFNEQPWRFLVARRGDGAAFDDMLSCLVDANRAWARDASALILTAAVTVFDRNGKPNGKALHDLGLAVGNMSAEATARGLVMHQMGGIIPERARELYGVPDGVEVVTAVAVGRAADPATLAEDLRGRDQAPRVRRPLAEQVFSGAWGRSAGLGPEERS